MKLFLIILASLVLEVFVWIGVGDLVGSMWYVFFWFIAAFFIGVSIVRKSSAGLMPQMQQMQAGQMSADPALSGNLPKLLAGFLLMIPGLICDGRNDGMSRSPSLGPYEGNEADPAEIFVTKLIFADPANPDKTLQK